MHVDDLADLCLLALENAPAASIFNGAHRTPVTLIEIACAASLGTGAGGKVVERPLAGARQALGWQPSRHSILRDLCAYAPSAP
ncbi:hypothetical protein [uncultured Sphingomonas sp.]|uniref:hypothetical protein n=1 Tax=uncultured Sphingomonas sp. TaxID=158754 RepID=UPI0025F06BF6|nr:hypothetical protein [uncultured Sphingomonas sp.]